MPLEHCCSKPWYGNTARVHRCKNNLDNRGQYTELKLFTDLLEYHGYTTIVSGLGEAAVALARQHRPELILMDIQLPDISGTEAAQRLKADTETRAIPIIAVTAFAMSGDREKILASGCDDYVAKPFNVVEFLTLVERYTTGSHGPRNTK